MYYLIAILYIIGCILTYGLSTGYQYLEDLKYVNNLQPSYTKSWHNGLTLILSLFSWLGVIIIVPIYKQKYKRIVFKYSFKDLWQMYESKNK